MQQPTGKIQKNSQKARKEESEDLLQVFSQESHNSQISSNKGKRAKKRKQMPKVANKVSKEEVQSSDEADI